VQRQIEEALKRIAEIDAKNITVETEGDKMILRSQVRSCVEWGEAECTAWRPRGVREVENLLSIKVWPMRWAGASRRGLALQRRRQGCFSR
jgi:osmotically-inducible protein OsmY